MLEIYRVDWFHLTAHRAWPLAKTDTKSIPNFTMGLVIITGKFRHLKPLDCNFILIYNFPYSHILYEVA